MIFKPKIHCKAANETEKQGQKATCEPSKESSICKLLSTLNFSFPPSPFTASMMVH